MAASTHDKHCTATNSKDYSIHCTCQCMPREALVERLIICCQKKTTILQLCLLPPYLMRNLMQCFSLCTANVKTLFSRNFMLMPALPVCKHRSMHSVYAQMCKGGRGCDLCAHKYDPCVAGARRSPFGKGGHEWPAHTRWHIPSGQ